MDDKTKVCVLLSHSAHIKTYSFVNLIPATFICLIMNEGKKWEMKNGMYYGKRLLYSE